VNIYGRPADHVTIEEWRMYIATLVGGLRLSQYPGRTVQLVANQPVEIASNTKSQVLYVDVRPLAGVVGNRIVLGGEPSLSFQSSAGFTFSALDSVVNQVILPSERLFAMSQNTLTALVTLVVA
jgi:hypothetical protein